MIDTMTELDAARPTAPRQVQPVRAGRVGMVQVVAAEAGLMAAAGAAYALPPPAALAAVTVSGGVLLFVVGRHRGRWWYEAVGAWLQLRRRRLAGERASSRGGEAEEWGELSRLPTEVTVQTVNHRNMDIGIGIDDKGWFAAIELTPPDGLDSTEPGELRLGWITRLAGPLSTLQVVVRETPFSGADPRSPCAQSYRELRQLLAVPPPRQAWVAVRLAPRDAADAADDRGGDLVGVHATLSAALARLGEALTAHGIANRVLDAAGLRQALMSGYGPGPYDGAPSRGRATASESWRRWRASRAVHLCYAVTGWRPEASPSVLPSLAYIPSAFAVNVSVVAGAIRVPDQQDGPVATRLLVRVVAAAELEGECQRQLRDSARRVGVRLVRLDGEHGPTVYATMPTASPYGWGEPW